MSRSNQTDIKNPAVRFFEWSGSHGKLKYFDKSIGEKGENVFIDLPFTFLVLDQLTTITGFNDKLQLGYWSNEIRNTKTGLLTVRTKQGIMIEGLYESVKNLNGARYTKSIYIAFREGDELVIGNFKASGIAISEWIEFSKFADLYKDAVVIADKETRKKGATTFFAPVFQTRPTSDATNDQAMELDKELQVYLTEYFKQQGQTLPDSPNDLEFSGNGDGMDEYEEAHSDLPEPPDEDVGRPAPKALNLDTAF